VSAWYNLRLGWSVLNEESGTGSGTLLKTDIPLPPSKGERT
jgi:hypothetical protein